MDELPTLEFRNGAALRRWLEEHHSSSDGIWIRIFKKNSGHESVSFVEVLEAGLSFGWSESKRRRRDDVSYLQRFTPRSSLGTKSERNLRIVERLESSGSMTPAGRAALGLGPPSSELPQDEV